MSDHIAIRLNKTKIRNYHHYDNRMSQNHAKDYELIYVFEIIKNKSDRQMKNKRLSINVIEKLREIILF